MSTTVVVAREFRGSRLYLTSAEKGAFQWSNNRTLAMQVSVSVAHRLILEAQEWHADAFAIDPKGEIMVPHGSAAAKLPKHHLTTAPAPRLCAYQDCCRALPGDGSYGTVGVSLSRADNRTLICSDCGVREAIDPTILGSNFKGDPALMRRQAE